ncbi:TPA: signal peptidase I [bacterium]|nr:signal peptidase I [bacterium]
MKSFDKNSGVPKNRNAQKSNENRGKKEIKKSNPEKKHKKNVWLEYLQVISVAFVLVFGFMRPFVVEAFKIPSASMEDTLLIGDRILVAKFMYGVTIPFVKIHKFDLNLEHQNELDIGNLSKELRREFESHGIILSQNAGISVIRTGSRWLIGDTDRTYVVRKKGNMLKIYTNIHILNSNKPEIGNIFVFDPPEAAGKTQSFIKRIVGLPGDTIEIRDGDLYRNGNKIEGESYIKRYPFNPQSPQYMPPTKVPDGHVFAMGDNRDRSSDSRVWGFAPMENIKGQAFLIYWSWDQNADWGHKIRLSRIGKVLR